MRRCVLLLIALAVFISVSAEVVNDSVMRCQADAFLKAMPAGLQHRQTLAVRQAIRGDYAPLAAVRGSRNAAPAYSDGVKVSQLTASLRLYEPENAVEPLPLLVYFHGGGWTFGSLNSCARFCDAMVAAGGVKVLAVDYRLAPESPYPCGLRDCINAVVYACGHADSLGVDAGRISVGGDSSGGNLALAVALSPQCRGKLESMVLFYPVTKAFADGSRSWHDYAEGFGLDTELMDAFNDAYLTGGGDVRDAAVSVGLCDDASLRCLPRALLVAAGRDILCDQGRELAVRMGQRMRRVEFADAVHLFITVPGQDEAFHRAVSIAHDFLCR